MSDDERQLEHQIKHDDRSHKLNLQRLEFERKKDQRDSRFFAKHMPLIVSAVITVTGTLVSALSYKSQKAISESQLDQTNTQIQYSSRSIENNYNLSLLKFLADNSDKITGSPIEQFRIRDIMAISFPTEQIYPVFKKIAGVLPGAQDYVWEISKVATQWKAVRIGDCTGSDTGAFTEKEVPEQGRCTQDTLGTIAVCWDGKVNKHTGTPDKTFCTYKNVQAHLCVGGASPGLMYVCSGTVEFKNRAQENSAK